MTSVAKADNVMVVFDGSNSMWGQIDGTAKIEIARDVMDNLLGEWVDDRAVGLMAYGHRRRGDCGDIEVLVTPGTQSRQTILDQVNGITPTGRTPLTDAVEQAARALSYIDQPATVVLISDGVESCDRDPCALAAALEQGGIDFTAHVVGFGLASDDDVSSLACIAENTGGEYISARNAEELGNAFNVVATAVAAVAPTPEPEPEPEPEPAPPAVVVTGPGTAVGGSKISITWDPTIEQVDYINIVPVGSDADEFGSYVRIGNATSVELPVQGTEGLYEIRYVHRATGDVLGQADLEITKPQVDLTAVDAVQTGAAFDVAWTPTINDQDYVTVVPMGADQGEFGDYLVVRRDTKGKLTAPADPGLYELRYVLRIDNSTVASRSIEVSDPQVTLSVPGSAQTGASFTVNWTGTVNQQDYITIVPMGADEGEFGDYFVVRDGSDGKLTAPPEPGMYEIRYLLREGTKTLASEMMEITTPSVELSGPASVVSGAKFDVSWTGTINQQDYIAIVPAGSDEGEFGNYFVVRDNDTGELVAPADPGLYELRYILREGTKTMARADIEVMEPEVAVSGPETALAGSKFKVTWTGAVAPNDYINIVPMGTEEGKFGNYFVVRGNTEGDIQAPSETGLYELRYILREGTKTLATAMVEIVEPEVSVSAPSEIRAGSEIKVSWTGAVDQADYINLVPAGMADDKFGVYKVVRNQNETVLDVPDETGLYEVRYMLREGLRVLARATVEVLGEDAQLSTGAAVDAPDTASPGAKVSVSWTIDTPSADQRVTVARADQAIFTWISATKITGEPPMDVTMPDEPGSYEIRILDLVAKQVLARKTIKIE